MPQILGQNVPWWAIGGAAVVALGAGYLIYRSRAGSAGQAQQAQSAYSPSGSAVPTAATIVPLPYPTPSSSTGSTATQASGLGSVTLGPSPGKVNEGIWSQEVATFPSAAQANAPWGSYSPTPIPFGSYKLAGAPQGNAWPILGPGGGTIYALGENVSGFDNPSAQTLQNTQLPAA